MLPKMHVITRLLACLLRTKHFQRFHSLACRIGWQVPTYQTVPHVHRPHQLQTISHSARFSFISRLFYTHSQSMDSGPPSTNTPLLRTQKENQHKTRTKKKYLGSKYGHTLTRTPRNPHKKKYLGPKTGHTYQTCIKTNPPEALTGNTTHAFL